MARSIVGTLAARLGLVATIGGAIALVACGRIIPDIGFPGTRPTAPATPESANMAACTGALRSRGVDYRRLPDEYKGGSCRVVNAVQLLDFGIPVYGIGPMTCPLADRFTAWVMGDVETAARRHFGAALTGVDSFGTYSCRNIAGSSNISEHALANAVDISGFRLSNGRRVNVLSDWNASGPAGAFLRDVARSACNHFGTVLTPEYNAAHHNHLHLDMASRKSAFCR